ncbi:MAG: methionine gamma-lyase family protein [Firmicutes bacterium]|nr:methionine gamma-lyase family protein [Bacillota bacterium]
MMNMTERSLVEHFGISPAAIKLVREAESKVLAHFGELDDIAAYNQYKVLEAMQKNRLSDTHFSWNTGYGYDDQGRETTEKIFADVFGAEAALVRTQIVNGTHALNLTLSGILRPGDELIYCTGAPYDTLEEAIGIRGEGAGSLKEFGIIYKQVELTEDGHIDKEALGKAITPATKMVSLQRATGYAWRRAIDIDEIKSVTAFVKSIDPDIICMADNCYGEFLDLIEPTQAGIDVMAGSLIKNPGGGLALSGGYVAGRADLIDMIAQRLTSPGIGGECGLTFGQTRTMLQGLFLAPTVTANALKGAVLCGQVLLDMGFDVCPLPQDKRSDIIQAVKLESPERMIEFCKGVQNAAPVDSFVTPLPWDMPGYDDQVIMAAGAFVQGSSIELSCDGPIREPYIVYFQGGLTYEHSKFGVIKAVDSMVKAGLVTI